MAAGELPAGPFRWWLNEYAARFSDDATMAAHLGLDDSRLRVLRWGRAATVSLEVADRLMTKAEEPHMLAILYPLDEAPANLEGPVKVGRRERTRQRRERVAELRRNGLRAGEIACQMGVSTRMVNKDLRMLGLSSEAPPVSPSKGRPGTRWVPSAPGEGTR